MSPDTRRVRDLSVAELAAELLGREGFTTGVWRVTLEARDGRVRRIVGRQERSLASAEITITLDADRGPMHTPA